MLLLASGVVSTAQAVEYVAGLGAEGDTEDSVALTVFGSVAVADETWLSAVAAKTRSSGEELDLDTAYLDAGIDHWFGPLGVRVGGAYWGDSDLLDSTDVRASIYWKNDTASLSLDYERRAFDLTIVSRPPSRAEQTVEFDADGVGVNARLRASKRVSLYAGGMSYDYSRDADLLASVALLRGVALSRLSMVNSLLDRRISGGVEVAFGASMLDLRAASWRTAVFRNRVNSLGVGYLTPVGKASDIEFRLASDDSDAFGRATVFSVYLYFYGT